MAAAAVVKAEAIVSLKIILMEIGLPRRSQSDGSDTMLEILEDCIVFLNEKYTSVPYIGGIRVRYK